MTWTTKRLSHLGRVRVSNVDKHSVEGEPGVRLCNYTDVYKHQDITNDMPFMEATASEGQVKLFRLVSGDTVFTKDSETADDIGVPAYVRSSADDLICGYHLAIFRPSGHAHPRFLFWALSSRLVASQWEVLATGVTRVGLKQGDMRKLQVQVPASVAEQRAIADFLDRETALIDALIEKQTALIDRLRERLESTVSAVIPVEPGAPRVQLRRLTTDPIEAGANESGDPGNPSEWPRYIRTTDIADMTTLFADRRVTVPPSVARAAPVRSGDILATRAGATIGKSYLHTSEEVGAYAGYLVRIRLNPQLALPKYAAYWMQSRDYWGQVSSRAIKSTIENFSAARYRALRIPLPTLTHQRAIVEQLDRETAMINELVAKTERFIQLTKERRSALITAAVTGQIDVSMKAGVA